MKLYNRADLVFNKKGKNKGTIAKHQKVKLKCDCCSVEFLRTLDLIKEDEHLCKKCGTIKYNKTRDPEIQRRMAQLGGDACRGKTIEEITSPEKGAELRKLYSELSIGENNVNFGGKYSRGFKDNPRYGTYIEQYGKEKAAEIKTKQSKASKGENNPMFGKPAPQGSGNGWQGWYNGIYFASIMELSFMVHCDRCKILYEPLSGKKSAKISYELNGVQRTYFPDFRLLETNTIIEVKPSSLIKTSQNTAKFSAANLHYDKFKIMTEEDFTILKLSDIIKLVESNIVEFIDRYKIKFENWKLKYD